MQKIFYGRPSLNSQIISSPRIASCLSDRLALTFVSDLRVDTITI
jgi:hypothetical protein